MFKDHRTLLSFDVKIFIENFRKLINLMPSLVNLFNMMKIHWWGSWASFRRGYMVIISSQFVILLLNSIVSIILKLEKLKWEVEPVMIEEEVEKIIKILKKEHLMYSSVNFICSIVYLIVFTIIYSIALIGVNVGKLLKILDDINSALKKKIFIGVPEMVLNTFKLIGEFIIRYGIKFISQFLNAFSFALTFTSVPMSYYFYYKRPHRTLNIWKRAHFAGVIIYNLFLVTCHTVHVILEQLTEKGWSLKNNMDTMVEGMKRVYDRMLSLNPILFHTYKLGIEVIYLLSSIIVFFFSDKMGYSEVSIKQIYDSAYNEIKKYYDSVVDYETLIGNILEGIKEIFTGKQSIKKTEIIENTLNIIKNETIKSLTDFDTTLAKINEYTYLTKLNRPENIDLKLSTGDFKFYYNEKESTNFLSIYESGNHIIISCRGIYTINDFASMTTIKFFSVIPSDLASYFSYTKKILKEQIKKEKTIFLVGHSYGCIIISNAYDSLSVKEKEGITGNLFAPPYKTIGRYGSLKRVVQSDKFKKLAFVQDWISHKVVEEENRRNVLIFDNDFLSFLESHSIKTFTNREINNDLLIDDDYKKYKVELYGTSGEVYDIKEIH